MTKPLWLQEAERNYESGLLLGRAIGQTFVRNDRTESYVVIPPALLITDTNGTAWTLGTEYNIHMEFEVLKNDRGTGEFASRIEYRAGQLKIYGREYGSKVLSHNRRHFI